MDEYIYSCFQGIEKKKKTVLVLGYMLKNVGYSCTSSEKNAKVTSPESGLEVLT